MVENGDLAIGFLTGTAEGTREAARLQETHLSRRCRRESIRELVPVPKPVPATESNVSPLVYSDPRLRSAEIKWNTSISNHLWRWSRYDINIIISIISSHKSSSYKRYHLLGKPTLASWVGGGVGGCAQV